MDPLKLTCSQQLWLHSSVGRALHRYRRGHGFESRWSLNFFQASLSQLLKLRINREDLSWRHLFKPDCSWKFFLSSKCTIYKNCQINCCCCCCCCWWCCCCCCRSVLIIVKFFMFLPANSPRRKSERRVIQLLLLVSRYGHDQRSYAQCVPLPRHKGNTPSTTELVYVMGRHH